MIFYILGRLVGLVCNILIIILLVRSVLSWFVYSSYRRYPQLEQLYRFLSSITEPIVSPVRRFINRFVNTGPIDLAPLATFFIIIIISRILTRLLFALI